MSNPDHDSLSARGWTVAIFRAALRRGGILSPGLYSIRAILMLPIRMLDKPLIRTERRRRIVEWWSVGAHRFTASQNVAWWNGHDWSTRGEEWTPSAEWKAAVVGRYLSPHVPEAGTVLEIGPGGGRWTEVLQRRASSLFVLDIAAHPLAVCRERFRECHNITYLLGDGRTIHLPDGSVDAVWSYSVFVHINPIDARVYVADMARVLRPGAFAVIHHPGRDFDAARVRGNRSDLTDALVLAFAAESGLDVVEQTAELVNVGDAITILRKPATAPAAR